MSADQLTITFQALADPTRRAILKRLSRGEASVQEIAKPFTITLPAITKHLKVLEKAKLIRRGRDAQYRPCSLNAEPLKQASDWVDQYRRFWEESFERLDEYLKEMQKKEKKKQERRKT
jgi:DNA-binding transcriptional ArsR family regulator